jgi:hypothetical protein
VSDLIPEPTLRDDAGAPETVYVNVGSQTPDGRWLATSLDVGSWRPLSVGDRVVALDRNSPAEFLVEVEQVDASGGEVFYRLRYLAELDPTAEPALDDTRSWLRLE